MRRYEIVNNHDRLLVIGTTLATFSAFRYALRHPFAYMLVILTLRLISARLVKQAVERHKPVLLLNIGPTRADALLGIEAIDVPAGAIIREVAQAVLYVRSRSLVRDAYLLARRGPDAHQAAIAELLKSGVVRPPPEDTDDGLPRPTGL